jgi:hypothetical protein
MSDLIKRASLWLKANKSKQKFTVAYTAELIADMTSALEAKGEAVKYWLCCGNTNPIHDGRCHDLLIGNKHHVRYGTKKEHSDWQTSLYTTPPSVDALIAEIEAVETWPDDDTNITMCYWLDIKAILDKYRSKP